MHRSEGAPTAPPQRGTPAPRLGVVVGGQPAKMTAAAATQFACEVVVLERQEDFPVHSIDTHYLIGDWDDPAWLLQLASHVDVVTLEDAFVSADALATLAEAGHRLWRAVRIPTRGDAALQRRCLLYQRQLAAESRRKNRALLKETTQ